MHSEKPSRSDVEVALNCVGFSPRSVIRVNKHGIPIVSIQLPLSLYEGGVRYRMEQAAISHSSEVTFAGSCGRETITAATN